MRVYPSLTYEEWERRHRWCLEGVFEQICDRLGDTLLDSPDALEAFKRVVFANSAKRRSNVRRSRTYGYISAD